MGYEGQDLISNKSFGNHLIAIIMVLGMIFGAFYWFIIRPEQIKKDCYNYAYTTPNSGNTEEWTKATNYYYNACLRRNGL